MQTGHRQLQTGGEPLTRAGGRAGAVRCGACAAAGVRVSRGQRRIHHTTGAVFPNMASPASPPPPSQRSGPSGPAGSGTLRAHGLGGAVGSQHPFCVSGCLRGVCGRAVPSAGMARGEGFRPVVSGPLNGLAKCTALLWRPVAQTRPRPHCPESWDSRSPAGPMARADAAPAGPVHG